jgi:hypothetical protein
MSRIYIIYKTQIAYFRAFLRFKHKDITVLAVEDLGADCLIYIELISDRSQLIWRAPAGTEV